VFLSAGDQSKTGSVSAVSELQGRCKFPFIFTRELSFEIWLKPQPALVAVSKAAMSALKNNPQHHRATLNSATFFNGCNTTYLIILDEV